MNATNKTNTATKADTMTKLSQIVLTAIADYSPSKRATLTWLTGVEGSKVGSELRRLKNLGWAVFFQGQWKATPAGRAAIR